MATGRVPTTANSPLTAKGDLFTYSTAPARLAVGNNGEQIVADSAATTGLRYSPSSTTQQASILINGLKLKETLQALLACVELYIYNFTDFTGTVADRWQVFTWQNCPCCWIRKPTNIGNGDIRPISLIPICIGCAKVRRVRSLGK